MNGEDAPNGYDGNQHVVLLARAYHLMGQSGGSSDHDTQSHPYFYQGHGSLMMKPVMEEDASMPHMGKDVPLLVQQIRIDAP